MFYTQVMGNKQGLFKVVFSVVAAVIFSGGTSHALQAGGWYPSQVIQPSALVARLAEKGRPRPVIIQVGFDFQYRSKHIPGAIFAGPAFRQDGLDRLRAAVEHLPRSKEIYIYCGCCPMEECPNVRPAYDLLTQMGFTHVKLVDLPTNFARDWIMQGLPVTGE
jgi:hypothetical protein